MKRWVWLLFLLMEIGLLTSPVRAESLEEFWTHLFGYGTAIELNTMNKEVVAKAQPDECFYGIGDSRNWPPEFGGSGGLPPCDPGGIPKINQGYIWSIFQDEDGKIIFGTVPNMICLVPQQAFGDFGPIENSSWVCEDDESPIGDWRPPQIFSYDTAHGLVEWGSDFDVAAETLRDNTFGFKAIGSLGDYTIVGGPSGRENSTGSSGVNVFLFHKDGSFVKAGTLPDYSDIRRAILVKGVLYFGVGKGFLGGAVLRWKGNVDDPIPEQFEEVGQVGGSAAYLAYHEGRIFTSTWGGGLWMSPKVPYGGLTSSHKAQWEKVFDFAQYDPEPAAAFTSLGGALVSYGGWLYWGSMHVPLLALEVFSQFYGPPQDEQEFLNAFLGTHRAISVFRGRSFGKPWQKIQILYGESRLPKYNPVTRQWNIVPTLMGAARFGRSGLGNFFNTYLWAAGVYKWKLYLGTFDWRFLVEKGLEGLHDLAMIGGMELGMDLTRSIDDMLDGLDKDFILDSLDFLLRTLMDNKPGADLWFFSAPYGPAYPEDLSGCGNDRNYGHRSLWAGKKYLWLGTANPMNVDPEGGWELLRLSYGY